MLKLEKPKADLHALVGLAGLTICLNQNIETLNHNKAGRATRDGDYRNVVSSCRRQMCRPRKRAEPNDSPWKLLSLSNEGNVCEVIASQLIIWIENSLPM